MKGHAKFLQKIRESVMSQLKECHADGTVDAWRHTVSDLIPIFLQLLIIDKLESINNTLMIAITTDDEEEEVTPPLKPRNLESPRDTQFAGFGFAVIKEMLALRGAGWIDFNADDEEAIEEYGLIIARRAYNLVEEYRATLQQIMATVECASIDLTTGKELPWHVRARQLLDGTR